MKIISDPVHKYITLESGSTVHKLIDSIEFQRLRHIRQLGLSFLTYPGAEHTRFVHSLGTYCVMKKITEALKLKDDALVEILQIGALLHDIGHGPFSHVFNRIFDNYDHEDLGIKHVILNSNTEVNEILQASTVTPREITSVLRGSEKRLWMSQLISSQLDADRLDYVLRDNLNCGVTCGSYDIDRIIYGIDKAEYIRVTPRGFPAVEEFLFARWTMHRNVYFHRTTVSAEILFQKIFKRAKDLLSDTKRVGKLQAPKGLERILIAGAKIEDTKELTDYDLLNAIKLWRKCGDDILEDLCKRFLKRDIFRPIKDDLIENNPATDRILREHETEIERVLKKGGYDPEYYWGHDTGLFIRGYEPYSPKRGEELKEKKELIRVITSDGIKEITKFSHITEPITKKLPLNVVCCPREVREEITGILIKSLSE